MAPNQDNASGVDPSINPQPTVNSGPAPEPVTPAPLDVTAPTPSPVISPEPESPSVISSGPVSPSGPSLTSEPVSPGLVQPLASETPAPVVGGMVNPPSFSGSGASGGKKKPLLFGGIAAFVALAGAAFYFLSYAPNTPNNVWNTGLSRSGKAISKVTETATDKQNLDKILKTQVEATIDGDISGMKFNGSLDTKFDEANSDSKLNFKAKMDDKDLDLGLNVLTNLPKDSKYPNIYFQFYGLKALGLDESAPEIAEYEKKWIAIEADYIEKNIPLGEMPESKQEDVTAAEMADLVKAVNEVNGQYLFTADPVKAVLVQKQFVAKEEVDGVKAYHYVVGINAANAKSYCKEMVNKVLAQTAAKKTIGDDKTVEELKKEGVKSCDEIKETQETFDMWMDAKYKLIYKARFADKKNKNSYVDIGQKYTGGDDINFFVNFNEAESKSTVKFNLSTNTKTNITSGDITAASTDENSPYTVKVTIKSKPFDGSINSSKPEGTVSIEEILNKLGIDPSSLAPEPTEQTESAEDPASSVQGAQTVNDANLKDLLDALLSPFKRN